MGITVLPADDPKKSRLGFVFYEGEATEEDVKNREPHEYHFECSNHGRVHPKLIYYSCPAQADCPECGENMVDKNGGINVLSVSEAIVKRPQMYSKEDIEGLIEKYPDEFTPEIIEKIWELKKGDDLHI